MFCFSLFFVSLYLLFAVYVTLHVFWFLGLDIRKIEEYVDILLNIMTIDVGPNCRCYSAWMDEHCITLCLPF
jgi:hypothetical protein